MSKKLRRLMFIVGLLVLTGCSSSPSPDATNTPSADPPSETALDGRALDLLSEVGDILDCTTKIGPTDELQSVTEVGHIACGRDATEHIYAFDDPRGMRYEIQSLDIDAPGGRGFLVGQHWLIVSDPSKLPSLQTKVGGEAYVGTDDALAHVTGFSDTDKYVTCELFFSSALVSYVSTGNDPIADLDRITLPGILERYNENLRDQIPLLASFGQNDDLAARQDLIPYANDIRSICHELYPS